MTHFMKLCPQPFCMIASGVKTVEIRLNDEKRKLLNVGDEIVFSQIGSSKSKLRAKVTALYKFDSFDSLFSSDIYALTGSSERTAEEFTQSMRQYYSEEREKECGVLAIELKVEEIL